MCAADGEANFRPHNNRTDSAFPVLLSIVPKVSGPSKQKRALGNQGSLGKVSKHQADLPLKIFWDESVLLFAKASCEGFVSANHNETLKAQRDELVGCPVTGRKQRISQSKMNQNLNATVQTFEKQVKIFFCDFYVVYNWSEFWVWWI